MTKDLPEEVKERFKRFDAHLPSLDDPTLIVLKGHLLAEEILENLIRAKCRLPEALDGIEIGFFLKTKLARALIGNSHPNGLILPESVWGMLDALNSLRNELAHALEPKKLEAKIQRFLSFAPKSNKGNKSKQESNAALYSAIASTLSYLACFETIALTGEIPPRLPENA
ncbi:hypothetical protein [Pseudomonas chlororaphis]|uniref:hypothetical protein n=1 Tax=Pseudomonas chlororaphis TaxID=587753 RepID=UPI00026E517A|nr:hypothetical protein [Pseudomonas chlororaphis]EJK99924.1 hypothetical protein Pchl3084_4781 [Pseudomonas chlororaphis subsp. aureofaciens 30-84]